MSIRPEAEQKPGALTERTARDLLEAIIASNMSQATLRENRERAERAERAERENRERAVSEAVDAVLDEVLTGELPAGKRLTRRHPSGSRRAICSLAATDDYRSLLARSALSYRRYADRWGWDLVLSTEDLVQGRDYRWGKVPLVRSLLEEYEWVLWLDADVVIVDLEADIGREVVDDRDLYLVEHRLKDSVFGAGSSYVPNTGIFLLRSCQLVRDFLDALWTGEEYADQLVDLSAFTTLLGYGWEPRPRLVEPTRWYARTKMIDHRFESAELDRARHPAFVHHTYGDADLRMQRVTHDLVCTLGSAHPVTAGWDWPAHEVRRAGDVRRRDELPLLLNSLELTGLGAEVGVRQGEFSEWLLELWTGERLISVDPWLAPTADEHLEIAHPSQDEQDCNHYLTLRRLARFGDRSTIWRRTSAAAASALAPESLSFAYLDAQHDQESVADNLTHWWPLIRPGGILAGHNYLDETLPEGMSGVHSAVDSFFKPLSIPVHATPDDGPQHSWIAVKPTSWPSATEASRRGSHDSRVASGAFAGTISGLRAPGALAATAVRLEVDAATVEAVDALQRAGVSPLLLKGASIAGWLYRPLGEQRYYQKLDLLVAPAESERTEETLERLGYARSFDDRGMPSWWAEHAVAWVRDDGTTVNVYRRLPGIGADPAAAWEILSRDPDPVDVRGQPVPALALPARALHLALHAAGHGATRTQALGDLDRAVETADIGLWRAAAALAAKLDAMDALVTGLRLAPSGADLTQRLGLPA